MNKKIGFIGCGNMGGAMLKGILTSQVAQSADICLFEVNESKIKEMTALYPGMVICNQAEEVAEQADLIILAVKPNMYEEICCDIRDQVKDDAVIVTMAAGVSIASVQRWFKRDIRVARTMPNTPALVMAGMTAISYSESIKAADKELVEKIFNSFGKVEIIYESLMDAIPAVSGSAPAYVFMMIEAMGDAAVREGIPRDQAYRMASQAIMGSALMAMETGLHPGQLKDMVTSPGGTTIEAVKVLEETGFRYSLMEAMKACTEKGELMSKKLNK